MYDKIHYKLKKKNSYFMLRQEKIKKKKKKEWYIKNFSKNPLQITNKNLGNQKKKKKNSIIILCNASGYNLGLNKE